MPVKLTHIALHVKDLQQSLDFYQGWADMIDISPLDCQKSPWLSSEGHDSKFALVLVAGAPDEVNGNNAVMKEGSNDTRIGFSVGSKGVLKALYNRAVKEGRVVVKAYEETADGARASFRMQDPNGYQVEFWTSEDVPENIKLNNISLHAHDMTVSRDFYMDWADVDVLLYGKVSPSCRLINTDGVKSFQLVLCDGASDETSKQSIGNISHIGFAVDSMETLRALYNKAQNSNLVVLDWVNMKPPAGTLFFIRDPDGYCVEFSHGQPLGKNFKNKPE